MWIIYESNEGMVTERININSCITFMDGMVHYETHKGEYKQIPVSQLREMTKIKPF